MHTTDARAPLVSFSPFLDTAAEVMRADAVSGVEVEPVSREPVHADTGIEVDLKTPEPLRFSVEPRQERPCVPLRSRRLSMAVALTSTAVEVLTSRSWHPLTRELAYLRTEMFSVVRDWAP